jgi:hypothetical protein
MDFGTTLKHLAPFAVPLLALCIPIFAIVMRSLERMRRNNNLHATLRHLSERGTPIPPELLEAATRDQTHSQKPWTAASQLRAGIINVAIGLGLIGAIPTMIGLGFLLIWRIETRQQRS